MGFEKSDLAVISRFLSWDRCSTDENVEVNDAWWFLNTRRSPRFSRPSRERRWNFFFYFFYFYNWSMGLKESSGSTHASDPYIYIYFFFSSLKRTRFLGPSLTKGMITLSGVGLSTPPRSTLLSARRGLTPHEFPLRPVEIDFPRYFPRRSARKRVDQEQVREQRVSERASEWVSSEQEREREGGRGWRTCRRRSQ